MLDDWSPYIYSTNNYGKNWQLLTDGKNGLPADQPTRVVREDPDREGLLYAGTEFGLFVSFDDGAHWQTFQLDLPATPVTDIKVHRKDLVLSTMGRSFWILDDVTPLHQINQKVASANSNLYQPRDTYRMRWSSRGGSSAPEYPPNGVMIHYYFANEPKDRVTLEILDAKENLIRTFFSKTAEDKKRDSRQESMSQSRFGDQSEPGLSKKAGMHRFIWDLRYPGPIALEQGRSGGSGPLAVPGSYQVRLNVGKWSQTQSFEVLIDPRVAKDNVTLAHLREQFDLNSRTCDRISEARKAVIQIRSIRNQIDSFAKEFENGDEASLQARSVSEKLTMVEEELVQTKEGKVGAQLKPKLVRQLTYMYGMTTSADQKPGRDAYERLTDIEKTLAGHLTDLRKILDSDIKEFNAMLQTRGKERVIVEKD